GGAVPGRAAVSPSLPPTQERRGQASAIGTTVARSRKVGYRRRDGQPDRRCAFCGRPRHEVRKLVAGPGVFICDRCIAVCRQLLSDERKQTQPIATTDRMRPRELAARLDDWVIGQERAKRIL